MNRQNDNFYRALKFVATVDNEDGYGKSIVFSNSDLSTLPAIRIYLKGSGIGSQVAVAEL